MFWPILNSLAGLIVAIIIAIKLASWPANFNAAERYGMGMIGGGSLLSIPPMIAFSNPEWFGATPFDDWSSALLRIGCCIYFIGRMMRHRISNWSARRIARKHLEHVRRH
jgi:hypothetical protein